MTPNIPSPPVQYCVGLVLAFRRYDSAMTGEGDGGGGGGAGAAGSCILLYNNLQHNSPVDYLSCR